MIIIIVMFWSFMELYDLNILNNNNNHYDSNYIVESSLNSW